MCGLLFTNDPTIGEPRFRRAADLLSHRGPDAPTGYAALANSKLGHRRLKILDLDDRSNQPFFSRDGRYVMAFNGEIYNFTELAREYKIVQRTSSDTEVLVELYAKYGPQILNRLNGMWACVILDTWNQTTLIARDRLGVKPLYITRHGESITVSSEVAPLLELYGVPGLDPLGVRQYLKLRTFFNNRTIYSGIQMFPAAHYSLNGSLTRYWSLPEGEQAPPTDEELRHLIESAVQYRLTSDVPVGSYLSGGLDSTIVAGLAGKPHTWTVGFASSNEFEWAQLAARRYGTVHSETIVDEAEFEHIVKQMITARREPLSVPNEVLLFKMSQHVKTKNTVVLSGEGADELFFGYDRIFRWAAKARWDLREFTKLYAYGSHEDDEIVEDAISPFMGRGSVVNIVAAFFQVAHLHGLLRRLDNATMQCAVEARVPFVDFRLVERLAGVPVQYRMANGVVKAPLKRIFNDLVPAEITNRPKVGFPVPLASIYRTSTRTPMDAWLHANLQSLNLN